MKRIKSLWRLFFSVLFVLLISLIGSLFTTPSISSWYAFLVKPSFNPPNWLFGPVWTILYIMIAISLFLLWDLGAKKKNERLIMCLFFIQLIFNLFWSIIFFGAHSLGGGLIVIVLLWLMILALIAMLWKVKRISAYLLVPYLLWVSFAAILNLYIVLLN